MTMPVDFIDARELDDLSRLSLVPALPRTQPHKRIADTVLAAVMLVLLVPVLLTIAVLVRISSPGPVFYRQRRVGLRREEFTLVKFRSMYVDAESRLSSIAEQNDADGPLFKMRADPRVTRVGRVLRRTSLDELPQLLNVLAGSMSLVGPRPALPSEVATYDEVAARRLHARPGITGLSQVSGRSDLTWRASLELDLRYVDEGSAWLDLKILLRTLPAVLTGRGAY